MTNNAVYQLWNKKVKDTVDEHRKDSSTILDYQSRTKNIFQLDCKWCINNNTQYKTINPFKGPYITAAMTYTSKYAAPPSYMTTSLPQRFP